MTREEAIEVVRKNLPHLGIGATEMTDALGTLIPELKESEYERIRKWLVDYFKAVGKSWIHRDISPEQILAYLEKQKYNRMQPIYDNQESFESALDKAWKSYNESGARTVDSCEDDYTECAHAKGFREGFLFGLVKQKEQKSAEWDELQTEFRSINEAFEDGKKEVIEHPEKYGLQKPAEWSEDTIRKAVKEVGLTQHQIDWFKNNVFPPKPEWSEEDENNIGWIVAFLQGEEGSGEVIELMRESLISWLRSLRPQYHGDVTMTEAYKMGLEAGKASSWKPSEEQMEALNKARRFIPYNCDILESLYNQLKKL